MTFITRAALARKLGVTRATLIIWEKKGELPRSLEINKRTHGWTHQQINDWLAKRRGFVAGVHFSDLHEMPSKPENDEVSEDDDELNKMFGVRNFRPFK